MSTVPETLRAYKPSTMVVRAVDALLALLPGGKPVVQYATAGDAARALVPEASEALVASVEALAADALSSGLVALGAAVDGADRQLARRPLTAVDSSEEVHRAQAEDATLKALALGAMAWRAGAQPGADAASRAAAFAALPSGSLLMRVWSAVDVVLPLGGTDVARMVALHQAQEASRLAALGGEAALEGALSTWAALAPLIQPMVDEAAARSEAIAVALAPFVPGLLARGEGASERIALQSDRMPIYKWLAARLAAEHAVKRATPPRS